MNSAEIIQKDSGLYIDAESVKELCAKNDLSVEQLLRKLVHSAKDYARPGISGFYVGAAALAKSGAVYLGANLEFKGVPLNASVHAEQFAIANARNHGETELVAIAVNASPCGHCRQFMNEMGEAKTLQIYIRDSQTQGLGNLLPQSFGPKDLGLEGGMMANQCGERAFTMEYSLRSSALYAAYNSYSPYTNSKSGIAIQTSDGRIYSGSYLENAGFNPSLSPLQSALVSLFSERRELEEIEAVLLIEKESGNISQENASRELLRLIAPQAQFSVEHHSLD